MDEFNDSDDLQKNSKYKHDRTIVHIDLDCFYAQVEILKNPELATKPVGIKQQHYVITSNYVAREYGVRKCMLITEAIALCPKLIIINGEDLHDYRAMSNKVTDVIKTFSNKVEKLGLDENFVDVSEIVSVKLQSIVNDRATQAIGHVYRNQDDNSCCCGCRERLVIGSHIASKIRLKIKEDLGMTSCAGIGHNKLLAKLVGPTHKPNQQTTVFPCAALSLVSSLTGIRAIPGIGRKTTDLLEALGIESVSDAQNASIQVLQKHLGKSQAYWIKGACFGVDDTDVKESGRQQVIGLEEASKKICSMQEVMSRLSSLIDRGMVLIQEDGRYPTTVRVSVRKYFQEYTRQRETKQCSINPAVFRASSSKEQILEISLSLFKKLVDTAKPFHLTLIGVAFTKFLEEVPPKKSLLDLFKKMSQESSSQSSVSKNSLSISDSSCILNTPNLKNSASCSRSVENIFNLEDIDESVLNELPEDIKTEVLQNCAQSGLIADQETSITKSIEYNLNCPPGVDLEVFNELPHEIQEELVRNINKTKIKESPRSSSGLKKQNSILNYFKK